MFTQVASRSSKSFLSSTVNTSAANLRPCFLGAYSTFPMYHEPVSLSTECHILPQMPVSTCTIPHSKRRRRVGQIIVYVYCVCAYTIHIHNSCCRRSCGGACCAFAGRPQASKDAHEAAADGPWSPMRVLGGVFSCSGHGVPVCALFVGLF